MVHNENKGKGRGEALGLTFFKSTSWRLKIPITSITAALLLSLMKNLSSDICFCVDCKVFVKYWIILPSNGSSLLFTTAFIIGVPLLHRALRLSLCKLFWCSSSLSLQQLFLFLFPIYSSRCSSVGKIFIHLTSLPIDPKSIY